MRKKLPSDPYEFELLLYAEKLAREEGIAGFEDSSDGESDPETSMDTSSVNCKAAAAAIKSQQKQPLPQYYTQYQLQSGGSGGGGGDQLQQSHQLVPNEPQLQQQQQQQISMLPHQQQEGSFKWIFGLKVFNTWLNAKIEQLKGSLSSNGNACVVGGGGGKQRVPDDLLKLRNDELNLLLTEFVQEIRKPSGEQYAPESVYYLSLGIQHYLQEKGRVENIFLDAMFDQFQECLNQVTLRYQIRINADGVILSRIEEEILWESRQLGAYSPFVLLNTILFFNTKYFFLDKAESHMQLSFANVKRHAKRNIGPNGEDLGRTLFLRYYPDYHGLEQIIYEQGENFDNPVRCPVELYNFYLSKW